MTEYEAIVFCRRKLDEHGLSCWKIKISGKMKRKAGLCVYSRCEIRIARWILNQGPEGDAKVRDIILHEIAHALTPGARHGYEWRIKAMELGAIPSRNFQASSVGLTPEWRWKAVCGDCGKEFNRFRRPRSNRYCPCGRGKAWQDWQPLIYERI